MGFFDGILASVQAAFAPRILHIGSNEIDLDGSTLSPAQMWRSQPHLRTVVGFLARNVAQLGLHVYERGPDDSRTRSRDSMTARVLAVGDGQMTSVDRVLALVADYELYDRAYWLVLRSSTSPTGWNVRRLPPAWVTPADSNPFEVLKYDVIINGRQERIPASQIVTFAGYEPMGGLEGSATIQALASTLREQLEAAKYRRQMWARGGRVSAVLERPKDAPKWGPEAREAFREDWYTKYTGNGPKAGGTPILEDGMTLNRIDFSAADSQYVEAAKLSLQIVASGFHVEPSMVGMGDSATYSNMRAFRKMLYSETLGPLLKIIEAVVNEKLIPMLGDDPTKVYVEFNLQEKLSGDFEEQARVLSTSTGRPWMTVNEARKRQNLSAIVGGDTLVVPLNVTVGGQASPTDSGSQNTVTDPVHESTPKAAILERKSDSAIKDEVAAFLERQQRSLRSKVGAVGLDGDWWDGERWNTELEGLLLAMSRTTSLAEAQRTLKDAGLDPDVYDDARTVAYLQEVSRLSSESINQTTHDRVSASDGNLDGVFADQDERAGSISTSASTFAKGFGAVEAGRQTGALTKTWVTGMNPRQSHAAMNGTTIPIDEMFSTGKKWPSGPNCNCGVQINYAARSGS